MDISLDAVSEFVAFYGLKILAAIAIFYVGKFAARWLSRLTEKIMKVKDVDLTLQNFVAALVYYAVLAFSIIAALGQLGIQTASFVAVVGAAGLAVGLALQGSLANFAAGVLILIFRPFKIGDYIEAAGQAGVVEKIMVFTTELLTTDNKKVIIPNSSVTGGPIMNYSAKDTRRVDLVMGISYEDDIDRAKSIMHEVVTADSRVLKDPAPTIAVSELADSSVNFVVRPWVATGDYWDAYFGLTEAIKKRFDAEGISIPYPQRDVHLNQVDKA